MATTNTVMHQYEMMLVYTPVLAEEDFKAAQQKVTEMITAAGGTIDSSNAWGMRPLAYPIRKKTTGLYWVLEYTAPADLTGRIEIMLNRDENVLRYMPTRLDKHAVAYNEARRGRSAPGVVISGVGEERSATPSRGDRDRDGRDRGDRDNRGENRDNRGNADQQINAGEQAAQAPANEPAEQAQDVAAS